MSTQDESLKFFTELEAHKRILSKVTRSYCQEPTDREDLAQEIVFQLWRSYPRFDGRCKFSTWMYKVALNVAISFCRSEVARKRYVISDEAQLLTISDQSDDEPNEVRLIYEFINGLIPLDRALMMLYLEGNSHHEISYILGITPTNVATKIGRIKQGMQRHFSVVDKS